MKRFAIPLACSLVLALSACGPGQPLSFPVPSGTVISAPKATGAPSNIDQVNRGMAVAAQVLAEAERLATRYTTLPRCDTTTARICSDRELAREIRRVGIQAHNAYDAARSNEANVELVAKMWTAIDAFRTLVPAG